MEIPKRQSLLVVEDDYLLASDLQEMLEKEGITVIGPAANEKDSLALLETGSIDGAILDINLSGRMVYPLAHVLKSRGIPFIFLTGYDEVQADGDFTNAELLQKPFTPHALRAAIERMTG